jgi:hypothetical protein
MQTLFDILFFIAQGLACKLSGVNRRALGVILKENIEQTGARIKWNGCCASSRVSE